MCLSQPAHAITAHSAPDTPTMHPRVITKTRVRCCVAASGRKAFSLEGVCIPPIAPHLHSPQSEAGNGARSSSP